MSYSCLFNHITFSTRDRRPFLSPEVLSRTCEYMSGIARNLKSQLLVANGAADHIHLAAMLYPTLAPADFIGKVKSNSSGWIHETFPNLSAFSWQDDYAAFSVSRSVMLNVKTYIRYQQEHHKKVTFQEEFLALLKKHGIQYDERYIWV